MDCEVEYEERYKNYEWDTYCDTFVIHTFSDGTQFISEYYDLNDECNKNNTVEEVLRFIAEKFNIDLEYKDMSNEEQKYIIDQLVSIAKYAKSIQAGIKLNDTLIIKKLDETELVGINFSGKCRVIHSGDE